MDIDSVLLKELKEIKTEEDKIKFVLSKMKESLSQEQRADMATFWKWKHCCVALFKESKLAHYVRKHLWDSFIELSDRARDLSNIAVEEEEFIWQQIALAVDALKKDEADRGALLNSQKSPDFPTLQFFSEDVYANCKRIDEELRVLNLLATKIFTLRKEIMQSKMRYKKKNVALKELNSLGDRVFPRKKALIEEVSTEFERGVEQFLGEYFSKKSHRTPVYPLLDEIKALQKLSKLFSLSAGAFKSLRDKLSNSWNILIADKQKWLQKKQQDKQQKQDYFLKIAQFKEDSAKEKDMVALKKRYSALKQTITSSTLKLSDTKQLCAELDSIKALYNKSNVDFNAPDSDIRKQQNVDESIAELNANFSTLTLSALSQKIDELKDQIAKHNYLPVKKELILFKFFAVEDYLFEQSQKEQCDIEALRAYCDYVKSVLDKYKKISGADLDMALSMSFNDMIVVAKERLKKWQAKLLQAENESA